jgi:mannose-1-phosphate guanylyltransferase
VEDPSTFGVVPTASDGRVTAFIEKPPPGEAPTNLINAGYYVLEPSVLERIAPGRRVSIERETFPALVADRALFALGSDAYWIDAGTPATYLRANLDTLAGGSSVIGDGCELDPTSVVERSVLLEGVVVEPGALVRDSIVGPGARIGANAAVTELSVVAAGASVPATAQVRAGRVPA